MIPRYRPPISLKDIAGILASPSSPLDALGELERAFCRAYGFAESVWFPYGRVAVRAFLECLDAPPGAKGAALGAFNCVALGNGVASAGWKLRFVDAEAGGFNQDPDEFDERLAQKDVSCGILVSQWGIPPLACLRPASRSCTTGPCEDWILNFRRCLPATRA